MCGMKWRECMGKGRRRSGSNTCKKRKRVKDEVMRRRTNKHLVHKCSHTWMHARTHTHTHARARAAHHTLNQSATDKKIMPLSFLECSLLYPHNYHHPSPTSTKHCLPVSLCPSSPGSGVWTQAWMPRSSTAQVI